MELASQPTNKKTMLQHVTHCDADALGCALLAGPAAIRFCDYQSVDEVVTQALEVAKENSAVNILISDIAPSDSIIAKIDEFLRAYGSKRLARAHGKFGRGEAEWSTRSSCEEES